ncbi:MAG: peptide chain release factor 1 [Endomicrobium sp.]|jgi:peptide chain release factor 1|nr:peptide chain release factor 1 [Endomicrobium sp.]
MFIEKLKTLSDKFKEIEFKLANITINSDAKMYKELTSKYSYLRKFFNMYIDYSKILKDITDVEKLKQSDDLEMKKIASIEYDNLILKKHSFEIEIKNIFLKQDKFENKNIIVEIRAGTGGEEASMFVCDIFKMYIKFIEKNNWKYEILSSNTTGIGGFKEIIFSVSGDKVWHYFKYEKGTHRVQRIPVTETSGRLHTSAVTVAVLLDAEDVDIEINYEDLRIDTYRASGAGGQHVNKTNSAIRITHLPTSIVVSCQDERSQNKNKIKALKILRAKLYNIKIFEHEKQLSCERKKQIGSGDRSEKIRTYNFQQNRVTDHRIGYSVHNIANIMNGNLLDIINNLIEFDIKFKMHI